VASPSYLAFTLNPRDALKFPFAVAIAALLIARGTVSRRPMRNVAYACGVGVLIGVGFGFRSDISFFLLPAALIIGALGQVDLGPLRPPAIRRWLKEAGMRGAAVAALGLSFSIGGWMPLLNDYILHSHAGDVGYHTLAMGLLGHTRRALFQRDDMLEGMYMYR